ncbi:acyl-CoA dehydrogenase family protein [Halomicrococcus sp. NG-SE-24]|uniref:acyl-CoA dehydrogenase family protein n=1 Tax=Halomicrococcus sp. NG-SE-24 TaxID=3436928 RepID=UPI003D9827E8
MLTRLTISDDHAAYREEVRAFYDAEIAPHVEAYEDAGEFPGDLVRTLGDAGLVGVPYAEDVDGGGLDYRSFAIAMEELARTWKLLAGTVNVAAGLVGYPIATFGAPWQRERWLTDVFAGESIAALAMTEPDAGSDAASASTTAERDGDELVVDGHKVWSTNGAVADLLLVLARTGEDDGHRGLSLVGIPEPHDRDGVTVVRDIPSMEGEAAVETEIRFDGVRVPAENVVGDPGSGFRYVMEALDVGRIGTAAQGVGVAQAALDASREFADEREQFGQPIRENQGISFKLADMAMDVEAGRLLTLAAADGRDRGDRVTQAAAMAKTFATDAAMDAATEAVQIHGSRGYSKEYPVERYMRVAKGMQIYDGTNEINRVVISKRMYENEGER